MQFDKTNVALMPAIWYNIHGVSIMEIGEYKATIYGDVWRTIVHDERYEIITNMLRNGMNIDMVSKIVKMTVEQVMAIGKKASVL